MNRQIGVRELQCGVTITSVVVINDKSFTVCEHALVLQKDTTSSKVFSRWIVPVVIYEVQSPYSYVVKFRAGFRGGGGQGAQGPRPPTKRGPPTKPFNFYFAFTIG